MGLTPGELQRLAEDILADRAISANLYCANCGYNLRTLPYRGRCPECGSVYNARKLWMDGVFTAGMLEFPTGDVFRAIVALGAGLLFTVSGLRWAASWQLMFGLAFLLIGGFYVPSAWRRTIRYFHFRGIDRRIRANEQGR